ncbi:MAG TPA: class III lanthipeptide [Candidatus Elarobacter sp.]|nr:class III lanthipeptide [Candidatus Elarobacter sp.]HEV2739879.1 class III lanthipeptide [Candidatus Elarobacter sp.]
MNRILELQALLPSIDVDAQFSGSGTSLSCNGGNCNSATSHNCNETTFTGGLHEAGEAFF